MTEQGLDLDERWSEVDRLKRRRRRARSSVPTGARRKVPSVGAQRGSRDDASDPRVIESCEQGELKVSALFGEDDED